MQIYYLYAPIDACKVVRMVFLPVFITVVIYKVSISWCVYLWNYFPRSWKVVQCNVSVCMFVALLVCVCMSLDFVFLHVWMCTHWPLSGVYWRAAPWHWATLLALRCAACSPSSDWSVFLVWSAAPASQTPSCSAPASAALSDNHANTHTHTHK